MNTLALTPEALFRLSQFSISAEWFSSFLMPRDSAGLKRVEVGSVTYILPKSLDSDSCDLVVIDSQNVFDGVSDTSTLDRIATVCRSIYSESVIVPTTWRPHREGSLISITPAPGPSWRERLHFDKRPNGRDDLLVFQRTGETTNFSNLSLPLSLHSGARANLAEAILTPETEQGPTSLAGIVLSHRLPQGFVQGATLSQWYSSKLTDEQRQFVDKPHDGPVRLRGSAGTGKTLSLVIKALLDSMKAHANKTNVRYGFLTHSSASADLVQSISESLDNMGIMFDQSPHAKLEVRTLYDLADEQLNFSLDQLRPLSLDGQEGRKLQMELIEYSLKQMQASRTLRTQFKELSSPIQSRWHAATAGQDQRFVAEIMNEFASVLDAEGIRAGEEKGLKYVSSSSMRPTWLLSLPSEIDRRFVLEVHRRYRKLLAEMGTLSVDQMVGDFNSFLDSNRWSSIRGRAGYDAIFVDELHLFTSIERQTLHKLIKKSVGDDGKPRRPPIFMAYDIKQSTRDTFAQFGEDSNIFTFSSQLRGSDLVKLSKVFRYTPEIAEFLVDLDATFPAIDIPGEWEAYAGEAQLARGPKPELQVFKDDVTLFRAIFDEARRVAMATEGGGRRVAVLCVSPEMFERYLVALPQYDGKVIPITGRDITPELRHAGRRFVFSTPEYVAGLQFDTVFLIHANVEEAPSDAGDGVRRRFISDVYLGSSRAERTLKVSASLSRGGASDIFGLALERSSLIVKE